MKRFLTYAGLHFAYLLVQTFFITSTLYHGTNVIYQNVLGGNLTVDIFEIGTYDN